MNTGRIVHSSHADFARAQSAAKVCQWPCEVIGEEEPAHPYYQPPRDEKARDPAGRWIGLEMVLPCPTYLCNLCPSPAVFLSRSNLILCPPHAKTDTGRVLEGLYWRTKGKVEACSEN